MQFEKDLKECLQVLHSGGLILYPTDTIWGIGCDATNEKAVERIYELKKRPGSKSMIVLLADEKDILKYVSIPLPGITDFLQSVKKPTTVIYEGAVGVAANLIADDGTVAIRIVKEEFCRHLVKRFGKPLVSTSANVSGGPHPKTFYDISGEIKNGVDYIVDYRRDDQHIAEPSSIIKWSKDGKQEVIRP